VSALKDGSVYASHVHTRFVVRAVVVSGYKQNPKGYKDILTRGITQTIRGGLACCCRCEGVISTRSGEILPVSRFILSLLSLKPVNEFQ
jgi:hypothetical protein